jgi:RES domain-containing protein
VKVCGGAGKGFKLCPSLADERFGRLFLVKRRSVLFCFGQCRALEPSPFYNDFRTIVGQNEEIFGPWSGVIFRSVSPQYARPNDILSGHGAYQAGGRWNAPGIYSIYGSLEPGLAADESFNFLLRHFGWQSRDVPPRMLVGIRVSLRAVLDLTNLKSVLTPLDLEHLLLEDWRKTNGGRRESRSQALGRAVTDLAEGILMPSHIRNGRNLVPILETNE